MSLVLCTNPVRWSISGLALTTLCHHISSLALSGGPLGSLQLPAYLCPDDDDYLDYEPTAPKPMYATTYFYLCNERNSHLLYFSAVFSFRYIPQHSPTTKPITSIDRNEETAREGPPYSSNALPRVIYCTLLHPHIVEQQQQPLWLYVTWCYRRPVNGWRDRQVKTVVGC